MLRDPWELAERIITKTKDIIGRYHRGIFGDMSRVCVPSTGNLGGIAADCGEYLLYLRKGELVLAILVIMKKPSNFYNKDVNDQSLL